MLKIARHPDINESSYFTKSYIVMLIADHNTKTYIINITLNHMINNASDRIWN